MKLLITLAVAAHAAAGLGIAQTTGQIPIRAVTPSLARTTSPIGAIGGITALPGGRVLVNDIRGRRLFVLDSALSNVTIIADTSRSTKQYYGGRGGIPLIPYLADSTLFVDWDSRSLVLIEPNGRIGRVMSAPIPRDALNMTGARADAKGRLIYRAVPALVLVPSPDGRGRTPAPPPDSALIVRADFDTRQLDTIGKYKVTVPSRPISSFAANGKRTARMSVNPVPPPIDDWTVLTDGSIAIVRGRDYHVDWIYPDGTRASSPKMPFDWRKLTDEEKLAKVDSAKRYVDSMTTAGKPINIMYSFSSGPDGSRSDTTVIQYDYVPLDSMGTYVSPIRSGYVKADADGNLWVLPTTSLAAKGGLLYDVINKKGEVFERVQLPADRDVVGFGRGGVLYLQWRDGTNYFIERVNIVRPGGTIPQRPAP